MIAACEAAVRREQAFPGRWDVLEVVEEHGNQCWKKDSMGTLVCCEECWRTMADNLEERRRARAKPTP